MKSNRDVLRDLDAMRDLLKPFDDDGREGMLACMICWFLHHHRHADRDAAMASLMARLEKLESTEREMLQ
jgi:hypothetical protein